MDETTTQSDPSSITILGINGHAGHYAAEALVAAGWHVKGFGRSNRHPIPGVQFIKGDAEDVDAMRRAVEGSAVVMNALNLPYDKWDQGRMEAQTAKVIEAVSGAGRTLLFPGNIYNYGAHQAVISPDTPQHPETPRGAIRVRVEAQLRKAAMRGDMQVLILRAGDFFGPGNVGDWFDQLILREAGKGRVAQIGPPEIVHAWAYLPDLGRALAALAVHRAGFASFETFHFEGHTQSNADMISAVVRAAPMPLKQVPAPLGLLRIIGLFNPVIRDILKMRYLWENSMRLEDKRLRDLLGPDFATPLDDAVAATVAPFFAAEKVAA